MNKDFYTYILSNKYNNVLYVGFTNDLLRRTIEHKTKINKGFTAKYNVDKLVHFEIFDSPSKGIKREKELKGWSKEKKKVLISKYNPNWTDLFEGGKIVKPKKND